MIIEIKDEIGEINTIIRLYGAPMEVGFISEEIVKAAGHFQPHWKNHDGASIYMRCQWTRDNVEFETFETIEAVRRRALGILTAKTHYKERVDADD